MEAHGARKRWTYSEFARLPDDGYRYEVVAGELVVSPSPNPRHQRVVGELLVRLWTYAEAHGLGKVYPSPLDVLFDEGDYLVPDLVFMRTERLHLVSDRGIEGPPDLVVEVGSPSTEARDRGIKLQRYRFFGVPEYWIVDAEARRVEIWRSGEDAEAPEVFEVGDVVVWQPAAAVPGLPIPVAEVLGGRPTEP